MIRFMRYVLNAYVSFRPNTRMAMLKTVGQGDKCSMCKKNRPRRITRYARFLTAIVEIWEKVDAPGVSHCHESHSGDIPWCHIWMKCKTPFSLLFTPIIHSAYRMSDSDAAPDWPYLANIAFWRHHRL